MTGNKENRDVELEIFNRFSRIVKEKFNSGSSTNISQLDVLYKQPEFTSEKRVLNDMNKMGLSRGVMAGVACFAFLRVSPKAIARVLQRRSGAGVSEGTAVSRNPFSQSSGGYKFDPPAGGQPQPEKRPGFLFRAVRLCLDTFVSLSIGSYASLYLTDKQKMMNQFTEIPLVEGRSLLSEELCGDFTREFQKFDRQVWDRNHPSLTGGVQTNDDGEHDFRNTMQGFVVNCRRRAIYEEELRKEQGLRSDDPVVVPSPGVPRDISVSIDDLLGEKESGGNTGDADGDGDDYFDTYFDGRDDEEQDSFSSN